MRNSNWIVSSSVAMSVIVGIGTASAADMAPRYSKAPVAAPVVSYNWSGCHVGINGGAIRNDSPVGVRYVDAQDLTPPDLIAALGHGYKLDQTYGTAGGQAGCDWQMASWVFGIEGDANWSGLNRSAFTAFPEIPPLAGGVGFAGRNETLTQAVDWFTTVRGRLGFAADTWLFYATGGVAIGNVRSSLVVSAPEALATWAGSGNDTRVGWTAGAGIEHSFAPNWSAKLEYLYVDLGTLTVHAPLAGFDLSVNHFAADMQTRFHVIRVGLNYHFNSPVVARY